MTKSCQPYLSGGLFFNLILLALKEKISKKDRYKGKTDGLSDVNVMSALLDVIKPERPEVHMLSYRGSVSKYKQCECNGSVYIEVDAQVVVDTFDSLVRNNYIEAVERMYTFVEKVIDINNKGEWLVKSLLELIITDSEIKPTSSFYVKIGGDPVLKSDLQFLRRVNIAAFLLGILHYILVNRPQNILGKEYLDTIFKREGIRGPKKYIGKLGANIKTTILLEESVDLDYKDNNLNTNKLIHLKPNEIAYDRKAQKLYCGTDSVDIMAELMIPDEYAPCEMRVVESLNKAYMEDLVRKGMPVNDVDELPPKYRKNLNEQRENFYRAQVVCRVADDIIVDSVTAIAKWKNLTYDYISDTANDDYESGFQKLNAVMKKVVDIPPLTFLAQIEGLVEIKERKGCCHLLVQDGRLDWSIHEEDN